MSWQHADGSTEHKPDPHYNGSGWMNGKTPAYWVCHVKDCGRPLLIDGGKVPITTPIAKVKHSE